MDKKLNYHTNLYFLATWIIKKLKSDFKYISVMADSAMTTNTFGIWAAIMVSHTW